MLSNHQDEIYIQRCVNHLIVILSHPHHCRDQWSLKSLWNAQMPVSWIWLGFTIGFTSTGIEIHTISHHTHNWSLSVLTITKIHGIFTTINYLSWPFDLDQDSAEDLLAERDAMIRQLQETVKQCQSSSGIWISSMPSSRISSFKIGEWVERETKSLRDGKPSPRDWTAIVGAIDMSTMQ